MKRILAILLLFSGAAVISGQTKDSDQRRSKIVNILGNSAEIQEELTIDNNLNNDPTRLNIDGIFGGSTNQRWSLGMNTDANDGSLEIYDHTGTVRLQKWETSGNVTIGEAGGPLVNIVGRTILNTRGIELAGTNAAGTRIGLYTATGAPATGATCNTLCANDDGANGTSSSSGVCLFAWHGATTPSTCSDGTTEVKFCLCAGVN